MDFSQLSSFPPYPRSVCCLDACCLDACCIGVALHYRGDPGLAKCSHLSGFVSPSVSEELDQALAMVPCRCSGLLPTWPTTPRILV